MSDAAELLAPDAGQDEAGTPSSLTSQKRPRDYGEQLKGLALSEDQDGRNGKSAHVLKKQKTNHSDIDNDNDNDSDLDDGEIVESSLNQNTSTSLFTSQATSISETKAGSSGETISMSGPSDSIQHPLHHTAHEPSEDGEIDSSMHDPQALADPDEPFIIDKTGETPVQHSGWNQGVSLGARTSFGKPATQLFPGKTSTRTQATVSSATSLHGREGGVEGEKEDEDYDDERDRDYQPPKEDPEDPKPSLTFSVGETTWNLPRQKFRTRNGASLAGKGFWEVRFASWVLSLFQANANMAKHLTAEVVQTIFSHHVNRNGDDSLVTGNKKQIKHIRAAAEDAFADTDLEALISKAQKTMQKRNPTETKSKGKDSTLPKVPNRVRELQKEIANIQKDTARIQKNTAKVPKEIVTSASNKDAESEPPSDEELRQLRLYFPRAKDPSRFCLCCSGIGHRAHECPLQQCKFCGSREHTMFACPSKQRCSQCRQLGHSIETCQEKLALAADEQGGCAFCNAEHADEDCSEIWRSFTLSDELHKKVKDIPAFCYTCGATGHYGPECGLPDRGGKVTGKTTWSEANRLLYVDQNSEEVALAWVDVDPAQLQNGNFHIPGRAKKQVHTHFVSSDDSEEDLIHPPIQRQGARGGIRISSNIGSVGKRARPRRNNEQSGRRQNEREFSPPPPPSGYAQGNRGAAWQPPLPPGPPPQQGNNGFRRSLAPPPPGGLPQRPPPFNSGPSGGGPSNRGGQNNRGSRGGYRGSRGGGRGRGRGRGK
ncbi:hypothetical protein F4804DRAFT_327837 [Jackrogersella minutella]|nr:hypothetical protein F4804DRAFT_327837 [Jackrogersella minutella]